jgi:hypothetical protein
MKKSYKIILFGVIVLIAIYGFMKGYIISDSLVVEQDNVGIVEEINDAKYVDKEIAEITWYSPVDSNTVYESQIQGMWNHAHISNIDFELYLKTDKTFIAFSGSDRIRFSGAWSLSGDRTKLEIISEHEDFDYFNFSVTLSEDVVYLEVMNGELVLVRALDNKNIPITFPGKDTLTFEWNQELDNHIMNTTELIFESENGPIYIDKLGNTYFRIPNGDWAITFHAEYEFDGVM